MDSPSPSKAEVIKQAIKQVIEEMRSGTKSSSSDDGDVEDDNRLLSKLMSQLERLEGEAEADSEGLGCPAVSKSEESKSDGEVLTKMNSNDVSRVEEDKEERIVKELKKLERQNLITHCLLSVMVLLTVAWQISQVSIILKLKDGVSHPFRSIGTIFKSMIMPPKAIGNEDETESSITSNLIESSPVHDLKISEIPHVELPKLDFGYNDQD